MRVRKVLMLGGPNVWASCSVLEAWVEARSLCSPDVGMRLVAAMPSLVDHHCIAGVPGGFLKGLRAGMQPPHVLMHLALEFQALAGTDERFGRSRATTEDGVYRIAFSCREEPTARASLDAALALYQANLAGERFDVPAAVDRIRLIDREVRLGPSTRSIVDAGRERGIPWRRMPLESLVRLGWGSRQRRIWSAETDRTPAIAQAIAQDKDLTRQLLAAVGVPVPAGRPVSDPDDAWDTARALGLPVVVKPRNGNQGRGVATDLATRGQIVDAFETAAREGDGEVIVERFAPGDDYRLLIVGGKLVAAARREPAQVIGDGIHTVTELVDEVNRDPRRGENHATVLSTIHLDDPTALAVLAEQKLTVDSVPARGQRVLVRRNANLSTGGTAIDVTELVHPEVAARAIEAAEMVGLDIAGVDIVARDLSIPLERQGGVIIEVNAGPGLRMHLEPSQGAPRPVGRAIVELMFPDPADDGRIPVVAVTGVNGKTTTTRLIAHLATQTGLRVGMTCTDGIEVQGRRIESGDCSGPASATMVLANPSVDFAVLETARGGILRAGIGFDRCDVAVVTNIGEGDHLGIADIETPEELARVKRVVVEAVGPRGWAVLNAADPLVAAMAPSCPGSVAFFARDEREPSLASHRSRGGRVAFIRDRAIWLADGDRLRRLVSLEDVPLTLGGRIGFQVENALAGATAAWCAGLDDAAIVSGLRGFGTDAARVPGRFNVLEYKTRRATVILDYGHNASSLLALAESLDAFEHRRRSVVFTAAGDRRGSDIERQGEILGDMFDRIYLYEDSCNRGMPDGSIVAMLRKGVARGRRVSHVIEMRGERHTHARALAEAEPGDLLVLQPDDVDDVVSFVAGIVNDAMAMETAHPALALEPAAQA
jgi:cyanophycin synthetase